MDERVVELTLHAPLLFDESIGYWTGEPDLERLERVLLARPPLARVERVARGGVVCLRGPAAAVAEEARLLRAEGLG